MSKDSIVFLNSKAVAAVCDHYLGYFNFDFRTLDWDCNSFGF